MKDYVTKKDLAAYATKQDVQDIVDRSVDKGVNSAVERMAKIVEGSATRVINAVSEDLGEVANDIMRHVDERFNKVEARLTTIEQKLDDKDADDKVQDARIARLEHWRSSARKPKLA